MENTLLTAVDASLRLRCSKALVYRLIAEGLIASVRISRRCVRVRPEDLEAYIRKSMTGGDLMPLALDSELSDLTKINPLGEKA